jgi:hypothetical protein
MSRYFYDYDFFAVFDFKTMIASRNLPNRSFSWQLEDIDGELYLKADPYGDLSFNSPIKISDRIQQAYKEYLYEQADDIMLNTD